MSDLSTRVRLRREQLGLSQEELARRMGYRSRSSITKLEKGINDLPQSKVEELAQALETTPAALLGLDAPCACPPGFEPLPTMVQVPLIGSIACAQYILYRICNFNFLFVFNITLRNRFHGLKKKCSRTTRRINYIR